MIKIPKFLPYFVICCHHGFAKDLVNLDDPEAPQTKFEIIEHGRYEDRVPTGILRRFWEGSIIEGTGSVKDLFYIIEGGLLGNGSMIL